MSYTASFDNVLGDGVFDDNEDVDEEECSKNVQSEHDTEKPAVRLPISWLTPLLYVLFLSGGMYAVVEVLWALGWYPAFEVPVTADTFGGGESSDLFAFEYIQSFPYVVLSVCWFFVCGPLLTFSVEYLVRKIPVGIKESNQLGRSLAVSTIYKFIFLGYVGQFIWLGVEFGLATPPAIFVSHLLVAICVLFGIWVGIVLMGVWKWLWLAEE